MDIDKNINSFLNGDGKDKGRGPKERYASFDYCFNYFQSFKEREATSELAAPENLQNSCLQLGYFLASWGMLKGKCFLLQKSVKFYEPLIKYIASLDKEVWEIDAHIYTERNNIALLIECKDGIRKALGVENNPSDTLLTKIMLGIFANTPAFDTYFKKGLSVWNYNKSALEKVAKFYNDYKEKIDQQMIYTFDFATGKKTHRKYTKAKLIDMVGFIEGIHKEKLNRVKTSKDRATL